MTDELEVQNRWIIENIVASDSTRLDDYVTVDGDNNIAEAYMSSDNFVIFRREGEIVFEAAYSNEDERYVIEDSNGVTKFASVKDVIKSINVEGIARLL